MSHTSVSARRSELDIAASKSAPQSGVIAILKHDSSAPKNYAHKLTLILVMKISGDEMTSKTFGVDERCVRITAQ